MFSAQSAFRLECAKLAQPLPNLHPTARLIDGSEGGMLTGQTASGDAL
jgi:hypothetical protein